MTKRSIKNKLIKGVPIKEQQCTDDLVENAAETPILEEEKKGAKISRAKDGSSLEDEVDEFCLDCKRTFKVGFILMFCKFLRFSTFIEIIYCTYPHLQISVICNILAILVNTTIRD